MIFAVISMTQNCEFLRLRERAWHPYKNPGLNNLRKLTKNRGLFLSDEALMKLFALA